MVCLGVRILGNGQFITAYLFGFDETREEGFINVLVKAGILQEKLL